MTTYTVLTTYPSQRSSANVGDQLIEVAMKRLVQREKGLCHFFTIFREDPLDAHLDEINATAGVLLPGFPIRDVPMYPGCYRLVDDLTQIKVPLIPIGANWNVYPGDNLSRRTLRYSDETLGFLKTIAAGISHFSCREFHAQDVLKRHGISNTLFTGDPAWYDPDFFGRGFHRPSEIRKVVFSPPLSARYRDQGLSVLRMLGELFPGAQKFCAMHLADALLTPFADKSETNDASMRTDVAEKNAAIRTEARRLGFQVLELAGDVSKLSIYKDCDLHVGYECHAHLSFFRYRRPSVLIAEDARGVGFNYTLNGGGFDGFVRKNELLGTAPNRGGTSGYCVSAEDYEVAAAREDLTEEVSQFLLEEVSTRFRRYQGVAAFLDETYTLAMQPFLKSLPT